MFDKKKSEMSTRPYLQQHSYTCAMQLNNYKSEYELCKVLPNIYDLKRNFELFNNSLYREAPWTVNLTQAIMYSD